MPIPATADLPAPLDEDEFENMVADALRLRFQNPHLVRFARRGQAQGGIDGADFSRARSESLMWQATITKDMKSKIADDLVALDLDPRGQPQQFVVALRVNRDGPLQLHFQELSGKRIAEKKCPVIPWFWEDTRDAVCSNDDIFRKWYSAFYPTDPFKGSRNSAAALLTAPIDAQCLEGHREAVRRARIIWFLSTDDGNWTGIMNEMLEWFATDECFLTEAAAEAFMAIQRWKTIVTMTDGRAGADLFKAANEGFATLRKELLRFRR